MFWVAPHWATLTPSRSVTAAEVVHNTAAARRGRRGQFAVQPAPANPLECTMRTCMQNRSQIEVSTVTRGPGRPLTGNSRAAAPAGEEADAGNEDDGAADHERSPGLGCRPQRHNTKEAWRAGGQ